jgi:2,3-bisphosphoglycerate-independent phosphoglycerate mutase
MAGAGPIWKSLVEQSKVFRLQALPPETETPEAAWLGLDPTEWEIPQGPLTLAALGHVPPERSVSFHLSLLGLNEGGALSPLEDITDGEAGEAMELAQSLATRRLILSAGGAADHGLVWLDGPREIHCTPARDATGLNWRDKLPAGEEEEVLHRFIDDSLNLLHGSEFNRRRMGEGQLPAAILWPWGPGAAFQAPNLPLRRGSVVKLMSRSTRLQGLARLFGDSHPRASLFGSSLRVNWAMVREALMSSEPVVAVLHPIVPMQAWERLDEIERFLAHTAEQVLQPLLSLDKPFRLTVLAPGDPWDGAARALRANAMGLGFNYDSRRKVTGSLPFDERVLDDNRAALYPMHEAVQKGLWRGEA